MKPSMILSLTGSRDVDTDYFHLRQDIMNWIKENGDAEWHQCERWVRSAQQTYLIITIAFRDEETYTLFRLAFDDRYMGKY